MDYFLRSATAVVGYLTEAFADIVDGAINAGAHVASARFSKGLIAVKMLQYSAPEKEEARIVR